MEYRAGIWKKKSQKGTTYCSGKIKIGTTEYQIRLFNNDKKGNEKAPDFNLILKDETEEQVQKKETNPLSDEVFAEFGNQIEIEESEMAF